jgi:hypothetical protein
MPSLARRQFQSKYKVPTADKVEIYARAKRIEYSRNGKYLDSRQFSFSTFVWWRGKDREADRLIGVI